MGLNEQQELINQITDEVEKRVLEKLKAEQDQDKQTEQQGKDEKQAKNTETIKNVFRKK